MTCGKSQHTLLPDLLLGCGEGRAENPLVGDNQDQEPALRLVVASGPWGWEERRVGLTTSPGLWNGRKYRKADGTHDSSTLPAVLLGGAGWEPGPSLGQEKGG